MVRLSEYRTAIEITPLSASINLWRRGCTLGATASWNHRFALLCHLRSVDSTYLANRFPATAALQLYRTSSVSSAICEWTLVDCDCKRRDFRWAFDRDLQPARVSDCLANRFLRARRQCGRRCNLASAVRFICCHRARLALDGGSGARHSGRRRSFGTEEPYLRLDNA